MTGRGRGGRGKGGGRRGSSNVDPTSKSPMTQPHDENVHQTQQSLDACTEPCIGAASSAGSCSGSKNGRGKYKCIKVDIKTKNKKINVNIPEDILRAVGENARDLVNYCGWVVRTTAPLTENNWKTISQAVGQQMWLMVKEKFNFEGQNERRLKAFILSTMQRLYGSWRCQLHNVYKNFQTDEERLENIPDDVNIEDWKHLIAYFGSEKFQRDLIAGENASVDQVWMLQHTKITKEGEVVCSDFKSQEIYGELHDFVTQQHSEGDTSLTANNMLLQELNSKSGYFQGKGYKKKPPSKRRRAQDVQQTLKEVKVNLEEFKAKIKDEVREEIRAEVRDKLTSQLNIMLQARLSSMFPFLSQVSHPQINEAPSTSHPLEYTQRE